MSLKTITEIDSAIMAFERAKAAIESAKAALDKEKAAIDLEIEALFSEKPAIFFNNLPVLKEGYNDSNGITFSYNDGKVVFVEPSKKSDYCIYTDFKFNNDNLISVFESLERWSSESDSRFNVYTDSNDDELASIEYIIILKNNTYAVLNYSLDTKNCDYIKYLIKNIPISDVASITIVTIDDDLV